MYNNKIGNLFKYVAISILFMLIGFIFGVMFIPASVVQFANMLLAVILLLFLIMSFFFHKKKRFNIPLSGVYAFTFIDGILTYPAFMYYAADLGLPLFFSIVAGTFLIFAVLSVIALKQRDNAFISWGKTLSTVLIVLIIVGIVNLFLQVELINILYSFVGIILFSAYILFDVNMFKSDMQYINDKNDYAYYVLQIYLDIINLMLDLLNFASSLNDD